MLIIFAGLPASGKSTLASALARHTKAVYIRIDTIEQAVRDSGLSANGPVGYVVAYGIATDNLRIGRTVVCDSVNPLNISRSAWRDVALRVGVPSIEVEVVCSDQQEHQHRIESRTSDVPGLRLPTWSDVSQRQYERWETSRIEIDTAGQTPAQSLSHLLQLIERNTSKTTNA